MKFFDCFSGRRVEGNFGLNFVERRILATPQKAQEPQGDPWACAMPSDDPHGFHGPQLAVKRVVRKAPTPEPATKVGEWVEWHGGKCPVPNDARVEVKFRCGRTNSSVSAGTWGWDAGTGGMIIVAYRLIPQGAQS